MRHIDSILLLRSLSGDLTENGYACVGLRSSEIASTCFALRRSDNALITMRRVLDRNGQDVVVCALARTAHDHPPLNETPAASFACFALSSLPSPPMRGTGSLTRPASLCPAALSQAWRESTQKRATMKPEDQEGWDILDANGGVGWELVQGLLRPQAPLRLSAAQVRRNPFITGKTRVTARIDGAMRALTDETVMGKQGKWLLRRMARSGTEEAGGFTEAQMEKVQELGALI